jgi:hypothetical protein
LSLSFPSARSSGFPSFIREKHENRNLKLGTHDVNE